VFVRAPDGAHRRTRVPRLLVVRGLLPRVRDQGADVPVPPWLPRCALGAPPAGPVAVRGVVLQVGAFGLLRVALPLLPAVAMHPAVQRTIVALSLIGILYGGLVAMVQPDFKKLIAYSSVAHLGFVMLGIWALTLQSVQGALLVMINHGISTGALFFLAG